MSRPWRAWSAIPARRSSDASCRSPPSPCWPPPSSPPIGVDMSWHTVSMPLRAAVPAAAICVLLACASTAVAAPHRIGPPVRKWSMSKIEEGVGKVQVAHDTQRRGQLNESVDLGRVTFDLPLNLVNGRAVGHLFSGASGAQSTALAEAPSLDPFDPRSAKGGVAHLDVYQAYEMPAKRSRNPSLEMSISKLSLEAVDATGPLDSFECPVVGTAPCSSIRTIVRFKVHAFPVAGGRDFFNSDGALYAEGHQHAWFVGAATLPDSRRAFWTDAQFRVNRDLDGNGSGSHLRVRLDDDPINLKVPLGSLSAGQLFMVHVTMDAEAINDRGRESAAQAFIHDPQHMAPRLSARGLVARRVPKFREPSARPLPAARCPAGPRAHAGRVQVSSRAFTVGEGSGTPMVLVTRTGGSQGAASVTVETSGGSARSGRDFKPTRTPVRFENGDNSSRLVE